jgi:hypothetical protein
LVPPDRGETLGLDPLKHAGGYETTTRFVTPVPRYARRRDPGRVKKCQVTFLEKERQKNDF